VRPKALSARDRAVALAQEEARATAVRRFHANDSVACAGLEQERDRRLRLGVDAEFRKRLRTVDDLQ
jgi:hypothetical protein